ncbi:hypothetical protein N7540_000107 [Penicillium herquei]|nr:hypothetical protein N7540_000107 [Penicillium herquei]
MHFAKVTQAFFFLSVVNNAQAWQMSDRGNVEEAPYPDRCYPDPCANIVSTNDSYVCGNETLGPVELPRYFPLSTELATYARFGDLCPYEFLVKWTFPNNRSYHYPGDQGFVVETDEKPISGTVKLPVGRKIDRFGGEGGNFFSPLGAPYIERALPPSNLKTYDTKFPANYHVYQILQELEVTAGPITPWFEQPGMGTQFQTKDNVSVLLSGQFIKELSLSDYDEKEEFADDYTPGPNA